MSIYDGSAQNIVENIGCMSKTDQPDILQLNWNLIQFEWECRRKCQPTLLLVKICVATKSICEHVILQLVLFNNLKKHQIQKKFKPFFYGTHSDSSMQHGRRLATGLLIIGNSSVLWVWLNGSHSPFCRLGPSSRSS